MQLDLAVNIDGALVYPRQVDPATATNLQPRERFAEGQAPMIIRSQDRHSTCNRAAPGKEFWRDGTGGVAVIFGLVILPIMLVLGAAIDYSRATSMRTRLQAAVDAGALQAAGHSALTQAERQTLAQNIVRANLGSLASTLNPTITETEPSGHFKVTATASVPTAIMQLARIDSIPIGAAATAANKATGSSTANVCILALSPTISPGLLVNSAVSINAPNCEIDVASTGNPAATFNAAATFNVSKICVAGTRTIQNGGAVSALSTGCAVASDPFASSLPTPPSLACTVNSQNYSGNTTLQPGVYCGGFNFNSPAGTITFAPGLYVFKGASFNVNQGWTMDGSAGVTFYFADTSYLQINSGVTANLAAPTTGTYANILMYEAQGLSESAFTIDGSGGHSFSGLIHLPSRDITFNDMSNVTSEAVTIVVNSMIVDTDSWTIASAPLSIPATGTPSTPTLIQ
jgi:Flp pilus assembly protein TadG